MVTEFVKLSDEFDIGFMNSDLIEVPALGVYELTMDTKFDINLVPWSNR